MIKIKTPDGINHTFESLDDLPKIASFATRNALLTAAADPANVQEYTPPEPIALPPEPAPAEFRAALAQTPSWFAWAETLPSVAYTNLTIAAANNNWAEAQAIYNQVASTIPALSWARAEWQQLADDNGIPITF